jgi:hypothetical protein
MARRAFGKYFVLLTDCISLTKVPQQMRLTTLYEIENLPRAPHKSDKKTV